MTCVPVNRPLPGFVGSGAEPGILLWRLVMSSGDPSMKTMPEEIIALLRVIVMSLPLTVTESNGISQRFCIVSVLNEGKRSRDS